MWEMMQHAQQVGHGSVMMVGSDVMSQRATIAQAASRGRRTTAIVPRVLTLASVNVYEYPIIG